MNDDTNKKNAAGQAYEPSALSKIVRAGNEGMQSPSGAAQLAGAFAPPGAENAAAQQLQAGYNVGREFSKEYMRAVIHQHGPSPIQEYNNLLIKKNLQEMSPHSNKGIAAAREKAAAQTGAQTSSQANQGILSYQSKTNSQSASTSKSGNSETTKGPNASTSAASKGNGQER